MVSIMPPVAKKIPKELRIHDDLRLDNYYWLNDKENKEVLAYLEAENTYYESLTAHTKDFQEKLFQKMKCRIKEDDSSVPYKQNGYWYSTRYEIGGEYPIYSRYKEVLESPEKIMFNGNEMAKGHDYFKIGGIAISPNNKLAAFGVDTVSRRQYTLYITQRVVAFGQMIMRPCFIQRRTPLPYAQIKFTNIN